VTAAPRVSRLRRTGAWSCAVTVVAALLLSGCSHFSTKKPKDDKKAADKPAVLVPFRNHIDVKRVWSASISGEKPKLRVSLQAAADESHVFIASFKGELEGLNLSDGKRLWKRNLKAPLSAGPSVAAGMVVVGTSKGEIIAVNENDGSPLWRTRINAEILAAPAVSSQLIVIRGVDGRLHGLSPKDGSENWVVDEQVPRLSLRGTSAPLLMNDMAICGFDNGRVLAINGGNGSTTWDVAVGQSHGSTELARLIDVDAPVVGDGDDLFTGAFQGRVLHLRRETGEVLWTRDLSSYRGMALDDSKLYVSIGDDSVTSLDRRNGTEQWTQKALARRQITAPAVYGGYVVLADADGVVHWLDPATGDFVARAVNGKSVPSKGVESVKISYKRRITAAPLVAGDLLLVFSDAGEISAFRAASVAAGAATGAAAPDAAQ
jgi:outer membrane protein assembly factor BamB